MEPDIWRWANAQGKPIPISLSELRSSLARGAISPKAWVWQKGWKHWLPACRVSELKTALGRFAREPQTPVLDSTQTDPPRLPHLRATSDFEPERLSTVPPIPRSLPLARRPPAPTVNEEPPSAIPTLRPPGAVPPPPRSIPRAMPNDLENWEPSALEILQAATVPPTSSQKPQAPSTSSEKPHALVPQVSSSPDDATSVDVPESEVSAPAHAPADSGSVPYDPDAIAGHGDIPWSPTTHAVRFLAPFRNTRTTTRIAIGVGLLSLAAGTWLLLRPNPSRQHETSAPPSPAVTSTVACRILRAAERVSPRVFIPVSPIVLDDSYENRIAVGFAETPTTAAGITVDPSDLSVQFPYRELQDKKILSVTPIRFGQTLSFLTVREGIPLSQARAIAQKVPFLFGVSTTGFVKQIAGQAPETVWALDVKAQVTDPRVVSVSGLGHAVTFRQGGQSGTILLGLLTETGQSFKVPTEIPTSSTFLGTPTLAVSRQLDDHQVAVPAPRPSASHTNVPTNTAGSVARVPRAQHRTVLLAFAGRNVESQPWELYLSRVEWGKPPQPAKAFIVPEGGPGFDAISPSVTGLANGYWLLQWSEGQTGQRQVRVQLLDAALRPSGKAHTVSPIHSNSGLGLLWAEGARAVSFFVVSTGKQAELWATTLICSQ